MIDFGRICRYEKTSYFNHSKGKTLRNEKRQASPNKLNWSAPIFVNVSGTVVDSHVLCSKNSARLDTTPLQEPSH